MVGVGSRVVVRTDKAMYQVCWVRNLKPLTVFYYHGRGKTEADRWKTEVVRDKVQSVRELTPSACPAPAELSEWV